MSQIFEKQGNVAPVTIIEAGPCIITQIKTKDKDNYLAYQVGFVNKIKKIKKTEKGKEFKYLKEERVANNEQYKVGDKIDVSIFNEGDLVDVSGVSKGKGFQGGVKRWGFGGMPATHGTKHHKRAVGSIGATFPQRVIKGKRMPGRMGQERKTIKNLKVIKIDKENNLIAVMGAVPGPRGTLLEIRG